MANKNYKISRTALIIAILSLICAVLSPSFVEGMSGGYALLFLFGFVSLTFFVTAFFYRKLGKEQEHLLTGEVLVHWKYANDFWKRYAEDEYKRDISSKKVLFFITAGWAILFAILFPLFDPESGIFVTYALGILILIIGIVAYLSVLIPYRRNLSQKGEAIISMTGVYLNGQLHSWNVAGMKLDSVAFVDGEEPHYIEFVYSGEISGCPVRVPVPTGEDKKAREIVAEFLIGKRKVE